MLRSLTVLFSTWLSHQTSISMMTEQNLHWETQRCLTACNIFTHPHTHTCTWDYMCETAAVSFQTTAPVYIKQLKRASSLLTARPTPAALSDNCHSQQSTADAFHAQCGKQIWESCFTVSLIRETSVIFTTTSDDRMQLWTAFEGHVSVEKYMITYNNLSIAQQMILHTVYSIILHLWMQTRYLDPQSRLTWIVHPKGLLLLLFQVL